MKLLQDCVSILDRVNNSIDKLGYEERDKDVLDEKLNKSEDILTNLNANAPLTEMTGQVKKFEHFTTTHKGVVDLYHRLKELQDPTLDDLEYALQKIQTETIKLMEEIEHTRTEEFEDLMREIAKLSKKVQSESEQVDTRLDVFMRKLSDTDNDDAISEMDQIFLKKEVNKLRSATTTIHSISVTILEEVFKVKKNVEKRPDKMYIPDDISTLK
jgi:hypothetical protein